MSTVSIELDADLAGLLSGLDQPLAQSAREFIVLEMYRRAIISSGKAAELLGMTREAFIAYSGRLGIPFYRITPSDLDAEIARMPAP
jgi:predicted HTH domain antitoxin